MKLLVAGDIFPTEKNRAAFEAGDADRLFGKDILRLFSGADFKVANLEGVLADNGTPAAKSGPVISCSTASVRGLLPLKMDAFSLANNHSMDFGVEGIRQTVRELDKHGISSFGFGKSLCEAKRPLVKVVNGVKIGVYACADSEFTVATKTSCGVNPFDELEICDDIAALKASVDYLIVLYHGMKENYSYPAPYVQRRCRKLVDKGADLVCCQHSHCIGCMEEYCGSTILYGQGNFMFCLSDNILWSNGLVVSVTLPEKKLEFLPVVNDGDHVHLAAANESDEILHAFRKRSAEILDPDFVVSNYKAFAETLLQDYDLNSLGFLGKTLRKFHLEKYARKFISRRNDLFQINALRCESHRDAYITALQSRIDSDQN